MNKLNRSIRVIKDIIRSRVQQKLLNLIKLISILIQLLQKELLFYVFDIFGYPLCNIKASLAKPITRPLLLNILSAIQVQFLIFVPIIKDYHQILVNAHCLYLHLPNFQQVLFYPMQQERFSESNQQGARQNSIIQQCVLETDQAKAQFLFKVGANNIDKCVKLKKNPGLRKSFREFCAQQQGQKKTAYAQQAIKGGSDLLLNNLKQVLNQHEPEDSTWQALEDLDEASKELLLKNLESQEEQSQKFDKLYQYCNNLLEFYECERKDRFIEDFKNFKAVQYENYGFESPENFVDFLTCLSYLPDYQDYKTYSGKNMLAIRHNTRIALRKALLCSDANFSVNNIKLLEENLIADPMFNFMSLKQISPSQKEFLFDYCWERKKLRNYAETLMTPKSFGSHISQLIHKIIQFLTTNEIIRVRDYKSTFEALRKFDGESFFMIQSIATDRKEVFNFIKRDLNCPYYFQSKELGFDKCLESMLMKLKFAIRNKLHELSVNQQLYSSIQDKLINGQITELIEEPISKKVRQSIIRFYLTYEEMDDYYRVKNNIIPLKIKSTAELYDILIQLDYQHLKFTDLKNMVETTFRDNNIPVRQLAVSQQRSFRERYQGSIYIKAYIQNLKIDWEEEQLAFKKKLIGILNEAPHEIDYKTFNQLIDQFLGNCDFLEFLDSKAINQNQKVFLKNEIEISPEYKKYEDMFNKKKALGAKRLFKEKLITLFRNVETGENIFKYYLLYGSFKQSSQNELIIEAMSDDFVSKNYPCRASQIIKMQNNDCDYQQFLNHFDEIFEEQKKKIAKEIENAIIMIMERQMVPDIERYQTNLINSNYNIEIIPQNLREMVKVEPSYKEYELIKEASNKNKKNILETKLRRSFNNLRSHPTLLQYPIQERLDIIDNLKKKGLQSIAVSSILRQSDRNSLIDYIKGLESLQLLNELKEELIQQSRNSDQVLQEIKNLTQKIDILNRTPIEVLLNIINLNPFTQEGQKKTIKLLSVPPMKKKVFQEALEAIKVQLEPLIIQYNNFGCDIPELQNINSAKESESSLNQSSQQPKIDKAKLSEEYLLILKQIDAKNSDSDSIEKLIKVNLFENQEKMKEYFKIAGIPPMKKKNAISILESMKDKIKDLHRNLA